MSEQLYVKNRIDNVPLSVSASHGDQVEEYVPHLNNYIYYKESDIDSDENCYAYEDDQISQTFEEWQIGFEASFA